MSFNNASVTNNIPIVLYYTRVQPCSTFLFHRGLTLFLTILRILLPIASLLLLLMLFPSVQRRVLYGHKGYGLFFSSPNSDAMLDNQESLGFLRNQVSPHLIRTTDGETLYSWLIMPLGVYAKHEAVLVKSWSIDEVREIALQIMRSDPKAVVAVYLHGNGNNLATQWRCEAYRNILAVEPDHLYVLAFDYRGFGRSSGCPTEEGLIVDASSVFAWIEKRLDIPRARTLLIGHSLGAAVAVASVERIVQKNRFAEYAGIVLCSGFTSIPELAPYFRIGGIIPLLKPLTWSKRGRGWIKNKLFVDYWLTEQRLGNLVRTSDVLRLSILHAKDDDRVPCAMSVALYTTCIEKSRQEGTVPEQHISLGAAGEVGEVKAEGKLIRKVVLNSGGHNNYMSWHAVSFEVMRLLIMTGAIG